MDTPKQKIVYQTNHERIFVGTCHADESPLEPGVWMIPGGCVELEPPEIPAGKRCRWHWGTWVLEDIPPTPTAEPVVPVVAEPMREIKVVVQAFMDETAALNGYESLLTAISYAEEPAVPAYQMDGKDFRAWRSLVWAYVFEHPVLWNGQADDHDAVLELLQGLPALPCAEYEPNESGEPVEVRGHAQIDPLTWVYLFPAE